MIKKNKKIIIIFGILFVSGIIFFFRPELIKESSWSYTELKNKKGFNLNNNEVDNQLNYENITQTIIEPEKFVLSGVPFIMQAPFADWQDQRQQDGCEEAAILTAWFWLNDQETITKQKMLNELLKLSEYQMQTTNNFRDTSAEDTAKLANNYFKTNSFFTDTDNTLNNIRKQLLMGNLIITPMDGQCLKNPYYSGSGPERHMIVVIGYDDKKQEFITHDPGTKRGENYHYAYKSFLGCMRDYPSGNHIPIEEIMKMIIVVRK